MYLQKVPRLVLLVLVLTTQAQVLECPSDCTDKPPDDDHTCAEQVEWEKCEDDFMQGKCLCSCNKCNTVTQEQEQEQDRIEQEASLFLPPSLFPQPQCQAAVSRAISGGASSGVLPTASFTPQAAAITSSVSQANSIGFAVGGARGIDNFRRNVREGFLPLPEDLTYEGIFNDYFFDTFNPGAELCEDLFCPTYSAAVTPDPIDNDSGDELYLAVGLQSGLAADSFSRKDLNLVILLDISTSMDAPFDRYFYDGLEFLETADVWEQTKIQVALEALQIMVDHLRPEDRLSIVTFDSTAWLALPLTKVGDLDLPTVREQIGNIKTCGSTNMEDGYKLATEQITQCEECMTEDPASYENRIILVTDAQPNTGDISSESLAGLIITQSDQFIFTTVIGVGLDFNSELIEILTKTTGANYYNVYSPTQFRNKMDQEFDFMVTPLVFNLKLEVDQSSFNNGDGWKVIKVYGSPNVDGGLDTEGTLININTLFPTPVSDQGIKGGIILLKMQRPANSTPLKLTASYVERDTMQTKSISSVVEAFGNVQIFTNTGVQKAVMLARYVDMLRGWIIEQRNSAGVSDIPEPFCQYYPDKRIQSTGSGCVVKGNNWVLPEARILPVYEQFIQANLGVWERQSLPLTVSDQQKQVFQEFVTYLEATKTDVGDDTLDQELEMLNLLIVAGET
eukprot:TRINITY_DN1966_c0_g1_i2.p1 TRINITY_DN1966_c0_g1~~TRINITY_DN1966_c0_g1_i2.p1  ORF type:complete len:679 (+),score=72.83 TRINITY_DN1966_c0_g1_i2:110-2146(+)